MRFRLSTLFALVTIAAFVAWYMRPPPNGLQVASELLKSDESQIRSILRSRFKPLDKDQILDCIWALDAEANKDANQGDRAKMLARLTDEESASLELCDSELILPIKGSRISHIYHGCKRWAREHPEEILPFVREQMYQKGVNDLHGYDNGECAWVTADAMLMGFTEGMIEHDLTQAFMIPSTFFWHIDYDDAIYSALYPEIRRRDFAWTLQWFDTLPSTDHHGRMIVLWEIERRMQPQDVSRYISWVQDRMDPEFLEPDRVRSVIKVDSELGLDWIQELQSSRIKTVPEPRPRKTPEEQLTKAERLLGVKEKNAYVSYAQHCDGTPLEFIAWADQQLRENPTDHLYSSWRGAITHTIRRWPKDEPNLRKVEPLLFRLDTDIINYPAIWRYLQRLEPTEVQKLADRWLENESLTAAQRKQLTIAFAAALLPGQPERAKAIISKLNDSALQKLLLKMPASSVDTWVDYEWWLHDVGLRREW